MPIGTTNSPGGVRNTKALPIVKNFGSTREQSANLWTLSLADSVTTSDAVVKVIDPVKTDSVTSSDGIVKSEAPSKSDSVTTSDAVVKSDRPSKSDSVTTSDAVAKAIDPVKSDSVTTTDAVAKSEGLSKSDSVTSSDGIAKSEVLLKADSISTSDAVSKTDIKGLTDTVTVSDAMTGIADIHVLVLSDSVTVSDSNSKSAGKSQADSIGSTDNASKKAGLNKSSSLSVSDSIVKTAGLNSPGSNLVNMAFKNRIRLPFQLIRPQFPETKQVFRKSNDTIKTLSNVIQKKYEGETDAMPDKWHQRLVIALGHDEVTVESDQYVGSISKDGDYTIDWPKFLDYPTAKAAFFVFATPFDGVNSNCMSCEQAGQLDLQDDSFPDPLEEDTTYDLQVEANDKICCFPAIFSVTSFDATRLSSATIDQTGKLTVHTKTGLTDANDIKLVTYRVTCSDGGYDEADVSGDIDGTVTPPCLDPLNVESSNIDSSSATFTFDPPSPAPDHYHWQLYKNGILVQQGDVAASPVVITGLTEDSDDYSFFLRSQCDATNDDGTASNYIELDFSTPSTDEDCGFYNLIYNCPLCSPTGHINVTYIDCTGNNVTVPVFNGVSRGVCALQTAPGSPTYINAGGDPNFHYTLHHSPC